MSAVELPRHSVIAAALRITTERLTREIAEPRDEAPAWTDFEWAVARAVSAMHGISPLLATRLRWQGPPAWDEFLHEQRQQALACFDRIGWVLAKLESAARSAGLSCVALKGSALREFAIHHPGERPMGDIDLLVRPADVPLAARVIESIGYRLATTARRHITFAPIETSSPHAFAEHLCNPLRIELHDRIYEQLPVEVVDITDSVWPETVRAGVNPYASFAALVRHVLLHASGNMRANAVRFLQLYDIALLARRMGTADWAELAGSEPRDAGWWMYPALAMTEKYIAGSVPPHVLAEAARHCPRKLRERYQGLAVYDVSWSNIRIPALPGREWSRSWRDTWAFARTRAFPKREAVDEHLSNLRTSAPRLLDNRWYRASQAERMLRWLFARPARVQTLSAVRAALHGP